MKTENKIKRIISDLKKYDDAFFLCHHCSDNFKDHGKLINTTEPTLKCCLCGADNARVELRRKDA